MGKRINNHINPHATTLNNVLKYDTQRTLHTRRTHTLHTTHYTLHTTHYQLQVTGYRVHTTGYRVQNGGRGVFLGIAVGWCYTLFLCVLSHLTSTFSVSLRHCPTLGDERYPCLTTFTTVSTVSTVSTVTIDLGEGVGFYMVIWLYGIWKRRETEGRQKGVYMQCVCSVYAVYMQCVC